MGPPFVGMGCSWVSCMASISSTREVIYNNMKAKLRHNKSDFKEDLTNT